MTNPEIVKLFLRINFRGHLVTEGRTVLYLFREKKKEEERNLTKPESITEIRVFTGEIIAGKLYYGFCSARRSSQCLSQSKKPP